MGGRVDPGGPGGGGTAEGSAAGAYNTWELTGVLVREEYRMAWTPLAQTPGLEGLRGEGVEAKYFGKAPGSGPFAYLLRYPPGARLAARRHTANLMQFFLFGRADLGGRPVSAGWYGYVPAGAALAAITAGAEGCRLIEIFDGPPGRPGSPSR